MISIFPKSHMSYNARVRQRSPPAEDCANPREHFSHAEGFCNVIGRSRIESPSTLSSCVSRTVNIMIGTGNFARISLQVATPVLAEQVEIYGRTPGRIYASEPVPMLLRRLQLPRWCIPVNLAL